MTKRVSVKNIIEALDNKDLLGAFLRTPATYGPWRTFFKAVYGFEMTEEERKLAEGCTGRTLWPAGSFSEVYAVVGRRGGKSSAAALMAVWEAISRPWQKLVAPGERVYLVVVAVDRAQAGVIFRYIKGIFKSSPTLRSMISAEKSEELELRNSATILVKAASFRSLRGMTIGLFIGDEVAFWRDETSASPDREILTAVRPALQTVNGRIVCISTPYSRTGVIYDAFKANFANETAPVLVWRAPSLTMNPTLKREFIDQQVHDDPTANRAEYMAEFRDDIEKFLSPEIIEPCIVKDRGDLPPTAGVDYLFTLDPSGGRSDSMCLCGSHTNEKGVVVIDVLRERKPPFSPAAVAAEFSAVIKSYGGQRAISDRYGGEWVAEAFLAQDVAISSADFSASEAYLELLPRITNRTIEMPDSKRLVSQLVGLERRARTSGGEQVTHFPGAHDDLANVVALAAAHAKEAYNVRRFEVLYMDDAGRIDTGLSSEIAEFRSLDDVPEEYRRFCKLSFAIRWLAAVYAADHSLAGAAGLVGEDPELMRMFNQVFCGWLGKVSHLYQTEITEQYERFMHKEEAGKAAEEEKDG